jgi:SAM-dependent methyltransferase
MGPEAVRQGAQTRGPAPAFDPSAYEDLLEREGRHFWFLARKRLVRKIIQQIAPRLGEGFRAIEAGCGNGDLLGVLEGIGGHPFAVGIDLFHEGLLHARGRVSCPLIQGDVRNVAFRKPFDLVLLCDVLEHVDDDAAALENIHGFLKPAGTLLLTVPAHPFLWSVFDESAGHRRRYTLRELECRLLRAGFSVDYLTHFMAPVFPLVWLKRRVAKPCMPANPTDLAVIPFVNGLLERLLAVEIPLVLSRRRIPFGSSILALASRNAGPYGGGG